MDDNKLELFNLVTDLRRAIMELVQNTDHHSIFIVNIQSNYSNLLKIDSNISKYVDIKLLNNTVMPPLEKAEYLLMAANNLQRYLLQ